MKFNGVTTDDVLEPIIGKTLKGEVVVGFQIGELQLPIADVQTLKADAESIATSMLWKLLCKRTHFAAQVAGVNTAKDFSDVQFAKGMIHSIELFNQIISVLRTFEVEQKPVETKK